MHTALSFPPHAGCVCCIAAFPSASLTCRYGDIGIVILRLRRSRGGRWPCLCRLGNRTPRNRGVQRCIEAVQRHWRRVRCVTCSCGRLGRGSIVDVGVFTGRAWRDGQEFVKGQDAGLAALPAYETSTPVQNRVGKPGFQTPFWPSWNSGGPG